MNIHKTVKNKLHKTAKEAAKTPKMGHTQSLSSTMSIPLVSMIEEIDLKSSSYLDILLPGQPQRRIELGRGEITIGRDEDCSIQLPITNVSRKHACLFPKGEEFIVEDLNSTNGTFVNGVKISRCVLRNNDLIRIGEARIQFIHLKFRV